MISFQKARDIILGTVSPLGAERVALLDAVGRVLAEDLVAPWDMPLWDNSAMDGYAVRAADCGNLPCSLRVSGFLPAGAKADGVSVEPGCAIRIMTGAPVPAGCDAVVPVEETDNGQQQVTLLEPVKAGQHVQFRGEDVAAGPDRSNHPSAGSEYAGYLWHGHGAGLPPSHGGYPFHR